MSCILDQGLCNASIENQFHPVEGLSGQGASEDGTASGIFLLQPPRLHKRSPDLEQTGDALILPGQRMKMRVACFSRVYCSPPISPYYITLSGRPV